MLVFIISAIEIEKPEVSKSDLEAKISKLNKIENDEYLATLKELTNLKRSTATATNLGSATSAEMMRPKLGNQADLVDPQQIVNPQKSSD